MTTKGTRFQYCKYGHDKTLPNGRKKGGGCFACDKERYTKKAEERKVPKQAVPLKVNTNSPWEQI